MNTPFTEDAPAAQSATNAPPSPWRCFAVTVGIASAQAAAQVITSWLCRQTHSSSRAARRATISRRAPNSVTTSVGFAPSAVRGSRAAKIRRAHLIVGINAGSLDVPSWFHPQFDIFASDAQPWDQMNPRFQNTTSTRREVGTVRPRTILSCPAGMARIRSSHSNNRVTAVRRISKIQL